MYKNKIEYVINYDDDSGFKRKIEFDDRGSYEESVFFKDQSTYVAFAEDEIDWLIDCLIDIKNNVEHDSGEVFFLAQKENE